MTRRRRRIPEAPEPSNERWLVSYADFITLMFAFFVVMYATSSINEGKYKVLADTLVGIFNQSEKAIRPIPVGQERPRTRDYDASMEDDGGPMPMEEGQLIVRGTESWVEIELKSSLLFPSGDAIPHDQAFDIIEKVARILAPFDNPVQVEGFTDNLPISTPLYPTNWELSAARAATIVRMLNMDGVAAKRLAAVGYGEHHPVADNATPEGRAMNRRVVLVVSRFLETRRSGATRVENRQGYAGTQTAKAPESGARVEGAVKAPALVGSGSH